LRYVLVAVIVGLAAAFCAVGARAGGARIVYVQPIGKPVTPAEVSAVCATLESHFGVEVRTLPPVAMPRSAFARARHRYRAEILVSYLSSLLPPDGECIIGLTADDISTTKGAIRDWGVIGLASTRNGACVVSAARRRAGANAATSRERLGKVAIHEIGHTLSLGHCVSVACVMRDAKGSVRSVDSERDFCGRCRGFLENREHLFSQRIDRR